MFKNGPTRYPRSTTCCWKSPWDWITLTGAQTGNSTQNFTFVTSHFQNQEIGDNSAFKPPDYMPALLSKMHHAAIDGASGTEIAAVIHDVDSDPIKPCSPNIVPNHRTPGYLELIWRSQLNTLKTPVRAFEVAKNTIPGLTKTMTGLVWGKLKRVTNIPRTRFNTNVSANRVFEAVEFSLDDIKRIKDNTPGVTVNDVAIAICGGVLRYYLDSNGELPKRSLAAMAPINTRTVDQHGTAGNQVSQMTVQIRSDIEAPIERLIAVNEGTSSAKELTNAVGAKTMTDYTQFIPSTLTASAARLYSKLGIANRIKPYYNWVITNVPGPQIPLYFTGAKMLSRFSLGPPIDGMGLFHGLGSYCGKFTISVSACREMIPDPAFYADCLKKSFSDLISATEKQVQRNAKKTTTNKPKNINRKPVVH